MTWYKWKLGRFARDISDFGYFGSRASKIQDEQGTWKRLTGPFWFRYTKETNYGK